MAINEFLDDFVDFVEFFGDKCIFLRFFIVRVVFGEFGSVEIENAWKIQGILFSGCIFVRSIAMATRIDHLSICRDEFLVICIVKNLFVDTN